MASKAELDLEARLQAIEIVLTHVGKIAAINARLTPEQLKQMRESGRERMLEETFPGADPAMADHMSAEIADRVDELLRRIETMVVDAIRKARQARPSDSRHST